MSALTEKEQDALDALHPEQQEREWTAMREDRDQFERKAGLLEQANRECERYAAAMEAALENIRSVCRLGHRLEPATGAELLECLDVIACLAGVRDHRGRLT